MNKSVFAGTALLVASTAAATVYNESIDGDLSGDRFNPTFIDFGLGQNTVINETVDAEIPGGDIDYFTFTVGAGQWVDSIIIADTFNPNGGLDMGVFVGLAFDDFFDFNIDDFTGDGLEGFLITDFTNVGFESIETLSGGLATLGEGDYTLWIQQGNVDITRVTTHINIVPAPSSLAVLGAMGMMARRRR
ncbi:MAG: hypothetical protein P1U30_08650 [Phycisphaerales bacterium]|nr:hypothetical protein [Phycisphaerales bacterium]